MLNRILAAFTVLIVALPTGLWSQCAVNAGADQTICSGQSATLGGSPTAIMGVGPFVFDWSGSPAVQDLANPVVTPASTTTYTVTLTDNTGCTSTDQITIAVAPTPAVNGGPDIDPCLNALPVNLPNPGGTGIWSGAPANMLTTSGVFTPAVISTYTLTLSVTQNGCTGTDQVTAVVRPLPTTNAGPDQVICQGQTVQLTASATSPNGPITLYTWSGGSVSNSLSANPTATPSSTTTYNVTAVDSEGCSRPDQITVVVNPAPTVNPGPALTLCNMPVPTTLTGQAPAGGTWSGPGVTPAGVFTPPGVGIFSLSYSVTSPTGCTNSVIRTITVVNPGAVNGGPDRQSCVGSAAFQLVPVTPGGTWSGSGLVSPAGLFTPTTVGQYILTYTVAMGACTSSDVVIVTVSALPSAQAGLNAAGCLGQVFNLVGSASGGMLPYATSWWNGSLLLANGNAVSVSPASDQIYTFQVVDANGCTSSDQVEVAVAPLPVVNAGPDVQYCNNPVPEQLSGFSPAGGLWSGPGVTAAGVFTPPGLGSYVLVYSYTSANGCSSSDQITVQVGNGAPVSAGPDFQACISNGNFFLQANTVSAGSWSGPGVVDPVSGEVDPDLTGAGALTYVLTHGTGSCMYTDQVVVSLNGDPLVTAGPPQSFCYNQGAAQLAGQFPANGTWSGAQVTNTATGAFNASASVGTYVVGYSYTDPLTGCSSQASKTVEIAPLPTAAFTPPAFACVGSDAIMANQSSGATQYQWNFGDNTPVSSAANPGHSFAFSGSYSVQLVAISPAGCTDMISHSLQAIAPPAAGMQLSQTVGCAPLNVSFANTSQGDNLQFHWDLATSQTNSMVPPGETYVENVGVTNYLITLTASNACGSSSVSQPITVHPRPQAGFTSTIVSTVCSPVVVDFQNQTTGEPDACVWHVSDGQVFSGMDPGQIVLTTGSTPTDYEIVLTALNECGQDSASQFVTVEPNLVEASFDIGSAQGCSPYTVDVQNTSTGATDYLFQIPGLVSLVDPEPDIELSDPGIYTIELIATDGCGSDTATSTVEILASPTAAIQAGSWQTCEGMDVSFTALTSAANTVSWDFGDGSTASGMVVNHSFDEEDEYDVVMTVQAPNQCSIQVSQTMEVHGLPTALFDSNSLEACSPAQVCFANASSGAQDYLWDFGNGQFATEPEPCITYFTANPAGETFTVVLHAENEYACTDQATLQVTVYPQPSASFMLPQPGSCSYPVGIPVSATAIPNGSVQWTVNGNPAGSDWQDELSIGQTGIHQIGLQVTSAQGCAASSVQPFEVYPQPVAQMTADPLDGCADLDVQFTNLSQYAAASHWTFGPGMESDETHPEWNFQEAGMYDVTLVITSEDGCTDTLVMPSMVRVFELPEASFMASSLEASVYTPQITFVNGSEGASEFEWSFGDGGMSSEVSPTYSFLQPGTWPVTLTAITEEGCEDRRTQYVKITNDIEIYIPNSFTPNGDGLNDAFIPEMASTRFLRKYELMIYDRWGTLVFHTHDPEEAWVGDVREGNHYGQANTYRYRLLVEGEDNTETITIEGMVTMVR